MLIRLLSYFGKLGGGGGGIAYQGRVMHIITAANMRINKKHVWR